MLHWWHEPYSGVRTHISDDKLFLPYVAAKYVRFTGDSAVLGEMVRYLESVPIESGKEDIYCEMRPGNAIGNLHDHCMRAFRSVQTGAHGLALMGGGDWNDGMNRVGAKGKGESVWLSEFMVVCAEEYAAVSPEQSDAAWLRETANAFRSAIEKSAWDGEWYLRAFYDDGTPLGSRQNAECRIDGISQAWAVLAGLDSARCRSAMNAAWNQLARRETRRHSPARAAVYVRGPRSRLYPRLSRGRSRKRRAVYARGVLVFAGADSNGG